MIAAAVVSFPLHLYNCYFNIISASTPDYVALFVLLVKPRDGQLTFKNLCWVITTFSGQISLVNP